MSNCATTETESLPLPHEASTLLEEVKEALLAQDLTNAELVAARTAITHFAGGTCDGGEARNSYRDTAYQDRYQDTNYRDSSSYADTASYRDAAQ